MPVALGPFGSTFTDGTGTTFATVSLSIGDVPAGAPDDIILFAAYYRGRGAVGASGGPSLTLVNAQSRLDGTLGTKFRLYAIVRSSWTSGTLGFTATSVFSGAPRAMVQVTPFLITGATSSVLNGFFSPPGYGYAGSVDSGLAWISTAPPVFSAGQGIVVALGVHGSAATLPSAAGFTLDLARNTTAVVGGGMSTQYLNVASRYQPDPTTTTISPPTWGALPIENFFGTMSMVFAAAGAIPDPEPPAAERRRRGPGVMRSAI